MGPNLTCLQPSEPEQGMGALHLIFSVCVLIVHCNSGNKYRELQRVFVHFVHYCNICMSPNQFYYKNIDVRSGEEE